MTKRPSAPEQRSDRFDEFMYQLCLFVAREKHALVPVRHREGSYPLGETLQRYRENRLELRPEEIERLEKVRGWSWSPMADARHRKFQALTSFSLREGHTNVPLKHREDGVPLGPWVDHCRRRGKHLPLVWRKALEAVPNWSWSVADRHELAPAASLPTRRSVRPEGKPRHRPNPDRLDIKFSALERFAAREGHACVPRPHVEGSVRLGLWVSFLRRDYRLGRMPIERQRRLEALPGWVWSVQQSSWDQDYAALVQFVLREHRAVVPQHHVEDGVDLSRFVRSCRQSYRLGRIGADRQAALEALPGWTWNSHDGTWRDAAAVELAYVEWFNRRTV